MRLRSIQRSRRRNFLVLGAIFTLVVASLYILTRIFDLPFGVVVAILGAGGGLLALLEIHNTKLIAQAEFIRDLNTAFSTDQNITELWKMLLLGEPIDSSHRILVSSYLTFYETIYLLVERGILKIQLVDDLFRNRFFTAVGNPSVLDQVLTPEAASFRNVHMLIEVWAASLRKAGLPQHDGYYRYLEAITRTRGFDLERLTPRHLDELTALQDHVIASLPSGDWLRPNAVEMLAECLENHYCLAFKDQSGDLVAAGVLFDPPTKEESIAHHLQSRGIDDRDCINLKVIMVKDSAQGNGLGSILTQLLEHRARSMSKREVLCTIHRRNRPSLRMFRRLGYRRAKRGANTSYGPRDIYRLKLPDSNFLRA